MKREEIIITYGSNASLMTKALLQHIDFEALLPDKQASIALKPNLVVAVTADSGATTHPEIVVAIIEHLQGLGYRTIRIVESAWVGDSTKEGFRVNGYNQISKQYKVPLVDVKDDEYVKKTVDGITMEVSRTILETDFLISLPVLKGHCQTAMTCALKNMKGVLLDFEEGGNPVETNRMFACRDSVLCDSYGASLMGFENQDIPYIGLAEGLGVGSADLSKAVLVQLNEPSDEAPSKPSGRANYLGKFTEPDSACSACYGNLIHALKRLDEVNRLKNLKTPICIGQGYKGKTNPSKVGVGICTRGLGKSLPGCPPKAIDMIRFIKELE